MYETLQQYWWFLVSLLGALLVFLPFALPLRYAFSSCIFFPAFSVNFPYYIFSATSHLLQVIFSFLLLCPPPLPRRGSVRSVRSVSSAVPPLCCAGSGMEEEKETEPKGSAEPPTRVGGGQWQQGKKERREEPNCERNGRKRQKGRSRKGKAGRAQRRGKAKGSGEKIKGVDSTVEW